MSKIPNLKCVITRIKCWGHKDVDVGKKFVGKIAQITSKNCQMGLYNIKKLLHKNNTIKKVDRQLNTAKICQFFMGLLSRIGKEHKI